MIDLNTPLEEIMKRCTTLDDLHELLKQVAPHDDDSNIILSDVLLNEAKEFARNNPNFTRADLQRKFSIGYPKAAKLFEILQNKK